MSLFYTAIVLCFAAAVSLLVGLISAIKKRPKFERLLGIIAAISAACSFSIYYYFRIILSGGDFSDERVIFVVAVYCISFIMSICLLIDGRKKSKCNE